jgi:hypothetical protein
MQNHEQRVVARHDRRRQVPQFWTMVALRFMMARERQLRFAEPPAAINLSPTIFTPLVRCFRNTLMSRKNTFC